MKAMLLLFCAVIFSGCTSTVYIPKPCEVELPARLYDGLKCGWIKDDKAFALCVVNKDKDKDTDYDNLKIAFEKCKGE
ncbi:MAG: hypothetical protein LBF71_00535 [Campylobacteraceae bacterium]|jgi:hypothetical protein|nr:hypothetical protein [Campylobacteraceae bacterium]